MSATFSTTTLTIAERNDIVQYILNETNELVSNPTKRNFGFLLNTNKDALRSVLTYVYDDNYVSPFTNQKIDNAYTQLKDKLKLFYIDRANLINNFEPDYTLVKLYDEEKESLTALANHLYEHIPNYLIDEKEEILETAKNLIEDFDYNPSFKMNGSQRVEDLVPYNQAELRIYGMFNNIDSINVYLNKHNYVY